MALSDGSHAYVYPIPELTYTLNTAQNHGEFLVFYPPPACYWEAPCHISFWHILYEASRCEGAHTSIRRGYKEYGAEGSGCDSRQSAILWTFEREAFGHHTGMVRTEVGQMQMAGLRNWLTGLERLHERRDTEGW